MSSSKHKSYKHIAELKFSISLCFKSEIQSLLVQLQLQTASEMRPKWDNAKGYKDPSEMFQILLTLEFKLLKEHCIHLK